MSKIQVTVLTLLALAGCTTQIRDVTQSNAPRYDVIRNATLAAITNLFLIREEKTAEEFLHQAEHWQDAPHRISDYQGHPLKCPGFMSGGSIVSVVKEGAHVRVVKILEAYNPETGYYNRVYATVPSEGGQMKVVRVDLLLRSDNGPAAFTNLLLLPDERYLRLVPDRQEAE